MDPWLEHTENLAAFIENGSKIILPKPKVYISGKPAQTDPGKRLAKCNYCNASVLLKNNMVCPNCGVSN